ncbi:unnamed protein product [Caenorhabditis auriculariae]|uniref:Uncharacterized protein n=1 Tax=Caenorhabditis auriculariae TaxID=2777116 RepID=A0A8S1HKM7_9PELO|nr:unnamed protein product [Caenorhabditis auriculariae]
MTASLPLTLLLTSLLATSAAEVSTSSVATTSESPHLTTDDEGFLTVIQGFATQLQCVLNTCSSEVVWFKDDVQIFNGTKFLNSSNNEEKSYKLQHSIDVDYEKGCAGECDDSKPCAAGFSCVDNQCCSCRREEYTLVLRNLTFEDSGRYRCQLGNKSELLEFQVEVLESGLKGGFHQNISYDHSECCQDKGISPLCRGMCKPSEMENYHFDPTSCKTDDYKHFLSCATEGGTRSHVHCCKTQLVPSFCYDFCSGDFQMLRRSHRLCLYYLPEIFSCLDRAYLPYPDPPKEIVVNALEHDKLSVCWQEPEKHESNKMFPILDYAVYYKEIPNFPLLGGEMGIPLLTGDYSDIGDTQDEDYTQEDESDRSDGGHDRTKREAEEEFERHLNDQLSDSVSATVSRSKRSTMLIVTRDDVSNSTTVREFAFQHKNTTSKCMTLSDLRSATRYIVYVTARNEYGTSVPSVRSIASTNVHTVQNNDSIPDVMKCCSSNNVSSFCATKMCNVAEDPSAYATISIATTCRAEWTKVSPCIADGRNHTECCRRKGVQNDCLNICAGSTQELGVHSVLCLNLDLQAIYQCVREGYESHPSSPVNVSISDVTTNSVVVKWSEPLANAHLVENYTLFFRKNEHAAPVKEVFGAKSPHTELGLEADTDYVVTVQSHSEKGVSLPSTAILFSTKQAAGHPVCKSGVPISLSADGDYLSCNEKEPCPTGFQCMGQGTSLTFCCPNDQHHPDENFQDCCKEQKMPGNCMGHCFYNTTSISEECKPNFNTWIQCASEGRDNLRCCMEENVSKNCLNACKHPFTVEQSCLSEMKKLHTCFASAHIVLPAAVETLEVTAIGSDSATIMWEDFRDDIIVYRIQLFEGDNLKATENSTADVYRFSGLNAETDYKARVIAINHEGEGPPSFNVTFTTKPTTVYEGDRPMAPLGLKVVWNTGPAVNVTWNKVTKRRNQDNVQSNVEYTVFYLDTEKSSIWTTVLTNKTWMVIENLREDGLYYVYVTAKEEDRTSRSSSILTLLAQQDSIGLPEPVITVTPDHRDGVYSPGENLVIKCTVAKPSNSERHLSIDLSLGPRVVQNDHGVNTVTMNAEVDATIDTATCSVSDTDGRQHVTMFHLILSNRPSVRMTKDKFRVLDDETVQIECVYRGGNSQPVFKFEKDDKPAPKGFLILKKSDIGYVARWNMRKVNSEDAGIYKCTVEEKGVVVGSATSELIISAQVLPVNPRLILSCCEDEGIAGDCLQACSIGKVPKSVGNCTQYAASLLKCSSDIRDHSDCCIANNVQTKCLPLCSGDSFAPDVDCSTSAVAIMGCFVRGHEKAPVAVSDIRFKSDGKGVLKVQWDYPKTTNYKYFAVYYRKKDDENWQMEKSLQQSLELEVDSGSDYEIGVLAANALGHSPLVFVDAPATGEKSVDRRTSSDSSSAFWILVILAFCGIFVAVLFVLARRRALPAPFGKIVGRRHDSAHHPSVAFENPAYVDTGNEVEIRGLGSGHLDGAGGTSAGAEWQSADLQAGARDDGHEYRNGMRYAKLNT